jgi:riboflavin synthase
VFTGIIETSGKVVELRPDQGNLHITIASPVSGELKIDQSVSHNGVCLTVIGLEPGKHIVTAITETLRKSNVGKLKIGDLVNLERCMQLNDRLDGHIVQGHVDQTGTCLEVKELQGSWLYRIKYDPSQGNVTVEKGSVCLNGISLTVVDSQEDTFSVHIIPYTYEHTNLKEVKAGDSLNIEFDIIGKYVSRLLNNR